MKYEDVIGLWNTEYEVNKEVAKGINKSEYIGVLQEIDNSEHFYGVEFSDRQKGNLLKLLRLRYVWGVKHIQARSDHHELVKGLSKGLEDPEFMKKLNLAATARKNAKKKYKAANERFRRRLAQIIRGES